MELRNERETLALVRDFLRARAVHVTPQNADLGSIGPNGFSMASACRISHCGTVACIAGHAWLIENPGDFEGASFYVCQNGQSGHREGLFALYFPSILAYEWRVENWDEISPALAADAIDNYLTWGDPYWEDLLPHLEFPTEESV